MQNKMEKVANILGLELGEYFRLRGHRTVFYLSANGLKSCSNEVQDALTEILESILVGLYDIEKLGFVPSVGNPYFVPDPLSISSIKMYTWECHPTGIEDRMLERNLICKTEEEALKLADIMLDAVKKYREENQ